MSLRFLRRRARDTRGAVLRVLVRVAPDPLLVHLWHNPLFDADWYSHRYQDVDRNRVNPELHFRRHGALEGRNPNRIFDTDWYVDLYPDVADSRLNPLDHYYLIGAAEGRNPGPSFDAAWYVTQNADVREREIPALLHYLRYGESEGRATGPRRFDSSKWAEPGAVTLSGTSPVYSPTYRAPKSRARSSANAPIGVVLHLFHTDLWPEIRAYLDNLDELRLFVSLAHETGEGFEKQILADYPEADVRYFANRGRDVGPFVEFLRDGAFDGCSIVCKIHSKRSPHRVDGDEWRRGLLGQLLGTPALIRDVEKTFEADPSLGLLGPAEALTDSDTYWGANRKRVYELGERMGQPRENSKLNFFAGSMFWFRPAALSRLRELDLRQSDFEPEERQVDGTLHHALERAIPVAVQAAGYVVLPFEPAGRRARRGTRIGSRSVKLLAFYLPQFHPIPENDAWWGPGFTEWTYVSRSRPLYEGHPQPRLPTQLGFYDLRLPETRQAQADLALKYGIDGFCYYYYWFNGRQILERPLAEVLASGQPDFPFCICWANENWTRRWDGLAQNVLLSQSYTPDSSRQFIRDVIPILRDPRYVRYEGRPVLMVYRVQDIPDVSDTLGIWREECLLAGIGEVHLAGVRFWDTVDVRSLGFDAAVDFPPHHIDIKKVTRKVRGLAPEFTGLIYDYEHVVRENLKSMGHGYDAPAHRGVMLAWDNTPRRGSAAHIAHGATPQLYEEWLSGVIDQEMAHSGSAESLVFINAWNEWGEGANLEPDSHFGTGFLDATTSAIQAARSKYGDRPVEARLK